MAMTPSQRPTREWPLLLSTLALVAMIVYPLWQAYGAEPTEGWFTWPAQCWAKLLLGPEQIACYCCFVWGLFIFLDAIWNCACNASPFAWACSPPRTGLCILSEDARPLQRRVDQLTLNYGPLILANLIRVGLSKLCSADRASMCARP